jgi:hypothetical protein
MKDCADVEKRASTQQKRASTGSQPGRFGDPAQSIHRLRPEQQRQTTSPTVTLPTARGSKNHGWLVKILLSSN